MCYNELKLNLFHSSYLVNNHKCFKYLKGFVRYVDVPIDVSIDESH